MKINPLNFTLAFALILGTSAPAATFTLNNSSSSSRTLAAGETGTVTGTGNLTVSGGTTAITLSGSNGTVASIVNSGTIRQSGDGRAIRNNTSGTPSISITNNAGGTITTDDGDVIRGDVGGSNWTITNSGIIRSLNESAGGSQAIDLDAVTTGSVLITNSAGGQIIANQADGIRAGRNAVINNLGVISAIPDSAGSSSDGIDTQFNSGESITNSGTISGRHGITGGENLSTYNLTVTNNAGGLITGINGAGINTDGALTTTNTATITNVSGATIRGQVLATTADGDGDGVDVDGIINLNNAGDILGLGAKGVAAGNAEGVSAGGGIIVNQATGKIIGSSLGTDAPNGDTSRLGNGILIDDSDGGNAIAATGITNSGLIQGKSGFGIKIIGNFNDSITNNAGGTITGTNNGSPVSVILAGGGNDTVNNAGIISHAMGNSQTAISTEGGDDTVNITGNSAAVTGGIDGGSGTDTLNFNLGAAGNTFAYAGAISNFETVDALSGKTTLTGSSTYAGVTHIGGSAAAARLEQNGTHTGGDDITVRNNGTLAGTGVETLAAGNFITVDVGGILAPGTETQTGRFTLGQGSVVLDGTASFSLDGTVAGTAGGYDQFRLTSGNLTLGAASTLDLDANFKAAEGVMFVLFDLEDPSATVSGEFLGLSEGTEFDAGNGNRFAISYTGGTGNDVILTSVSVPEPGATLLLGLGGLGLLIRRRSPRVAERSSV